MITILLTTIIAIVMAIIIGQLHLTLAEVTTLNPQGVLSVATATTTTTARVVQEVLVAQS